MSTTHETQRARVREAYGEIARTRTAPSKCCGKESHGGDYTDDEEALGGQLYRGGLAHHHRLGEAIEGRLSGRAVVLALDQWHLGLAGCRRCGGDGKQERGRERDSELCHAGQCGMARAEGVNPSAPRGQTGRTSRASGPLRPGPISNSTTWPGSSVRKPAPAMLL